MFASDIEKKIVDTIRKSPLGLTSSEMAKYLGVNRVTLTKYLAVIKEKALIDFKQFGMAKLWYIPIKLNKEVFLSKIMVNLTFKLSKEDLNSLFEEAGLKYGEEINTMYKEFYNVEKLNLDQLVEVYVDIGKKLGGKIKYNLKTNEMVIMEIVDNPFKNQNKELMNGVLSALFAKIASLNFGYSRTVIEIKKDKEVEKEFITVYLKKKGDEI